jgi:hypothetical protein
MFFKFEMPALQALEGASPFPKLQGSVLLPLSFLAIENASSSYG